jgi:hypothetical protein
MDTITVVASLSGLFIAGANVVFWAITKFNDLSHMQKTLDRIETNILNLDKKLDKTTERISTIEGKCLARHGD